MPCGRGKSWDTGPVTIATMGILTPGVPLPLASPPAACDPQPGILDPLYRQGLHHCPRPHAG